MNRKSIVMLSLSAAMMSTGVFTYTAPVFAQSISAYADENDVTVTSLQELASRLAADEADGTARGTVYSVETYEDSLDTPLYIPAFASVRFERPAKIQLTMTDSRPGVVLGEGASLYGGTLMYAGTGNAVEVQAMEGMKGSDQGPISLTAINIVADQAANGLSIPHRDSIALKNVSISTPKGSGISCGLIGELQMDYVTVDAGHFGLVQQPIEAYDSQSFALGSRIVLTDCEIRSLDECREAGKAYTGIYINNSEAAGEYPDKTLLQLINTSVSGPTTVEVKCGRVDIHGNMPIANLVGQVQRTSNLRSTVANPIKRYTPSEENPTTCGYALVLSNHSTPGNPVPSKGQLSCAEDENGKDGGLFEGPVSVIVDGKEMGDVQPAGVSLWFTAGTLKKSAGSSEAYQINHNFLQPGYSQNAEGKIVNEPAVNPDVPDYPDQPGTPDQPEERTLTTMNPGNPKPLGNGTLFPYKNGLYLSWPDGAATKNIWVEANGKLYCFGSDGAALTGKWTVDGKECVFTEGGVLQTASKANEWAKEDGKWVYYEANGEKAMGPREIEVNGQKHRFMFDGKGHMVTGFYRDKVDTYYYDSAGAMKIGWLNLNGDWYYFGSNGARKYNWVQDKGKWYYMSPNDEGKLVMKQWKDMDGTRYYFDSAGEMATGWKTLPNPNGSGLGSYYFRADGALLRNTTTPDGYWVDANGRWV